jgi:hypothetical protein
VHGGDPTFANEIHQMVAVVNNLPLTVTFAAVVGNAPATPTVRDVRSGGDVGGALSSKGIVGVPANPLSLVQLPPPGRALAPLQRRALQMSRRTLVQPLLRA